KANAYGHRIAAPLNRVLVFGKGDSETGRRHTHVFAAGVLQDRMAHVGTGNRSAHVRSNNRRHVVAPDVAVQTASKCEFASRRDTHLSGQPESAVEARLA